MNGFATDDSPFWRFSLALYGQADVAAACISLQDECGADVNVLLYVLFLARVGRIIDFDDVNRIEALAAPWRNEIIRPLRSVRRGLKAPPPHFQDDTTTMLRGMVHRVELEAERLLQVALERDLPAELVGVPGTEKNDCSASNLRVYAQRLGGFPPAPVDLILRRLGDT